MKKNSLINRILLCSMATTCLISLAGCGIETQPYTEEEIDKIGEYAALLMLGNDPDESRLVDIEAPDAEDEDEIDADQLIEPITEDESETEDETEVADKTEVTDADSDVENESQDSSNIDIVDNTGNQGNEVPTVSLEEFLGFAEGVTATYKGYEWKKTLTNDSGSYFYDPAEGNYFLIVNYTIYNASGAVQDIDFLYAGLSFNLRINDDKTVIANEIPINEDMPTYIGRLQNGTGVDLILTFECDSNYVDAISTMKLTVKSREDSCVVVLE